MVRKMKQLLKEENGAVQIVEATIVFPVMFIILFFLIYMGNAQFIRAQIESIVTEKAIKGANYCTDPILQNIKENESVPGLKDMDLDPYRYFSNMSDITRTISGEVKTGIESSSATLFPNMRPVVKTKQSDIAKYKNYVVFSTFAVEVKCEVGFPIKFLGASTPTMMVINARTEIAVNDTAEFIRNTDMTIDYFEDSKIGKNIKNVFEKINEFIQNFAGNGG